MQQEGSGAAGSAMMRVTDPGEARRIIRSGGYAGHTAGVAAKFVQGNAVSYTHLTLPTNREV